MLNSIITFSVRNKLVVGLLVLGLVAWGTYEVTRLPIDAVPDITDNQIQVITVSPALGAPDVERLITFPVEQSCSNIPGLKQLRSFSRFGLSLVTIVFNDDVDVYWARQQVSERLQSVRQTIPADVGLPEMAPVTTGLGEVFQYVVRPKEGYEHKYNVTELRTLQDWLVRRHLLGTPGVADVSSFGGKLKQYEIAVTPEQLRAHNITIADVFDALEKNNGNTGGAYIEKGPTVLYIRSEGLTNNIEDIENIVVKSTAKAVPLLIRDVAKVQYGAAIRYGAMTYNDKGEVAGAVVMMLKGENSSAVVKRVKAKIEEVQKSLPEGVVIEPFLDRTKMVNHAIATVETNLLEGALIVVLVLVFFLGNIRAGLIVSSVIPLSMLFAVILMNQFGVGGNLMSLGAIDFGLIVDGSVIVVEAILHRFAHSKHFRNVGIVTQQTMDEEVSHATGSMIKSAVFSQIIILVVYLPILSLEGIEGKMFRPMALTIAFAILGAFLLSITYVPMMSALFLSKKLNHRQTLSDRMIAWLQQRYQPMLATALSIPKVIITVTTGLFLLSAVLLSTLGGEFIPELEEGDFAIDTRLLTGSNLQATIGATQKTSKILLDSFPEVEKVVTKIGSAEIPTDPMPLEAADMMVILKDKDQWTSASSFDELAEKMADALSVVPGITVGFQYPVQMRFNELMTGARQDVVCKIFGHDLDTLAHYAQGLNNIIKKVDGAVDVYVESVTGMPQVVIAYNREAMATYGVNVQDINRVVNTAFAGQVAGQVYEGEKRFDLVVRVEASARRDIGDVQNLLIPLANGAQIPLGYVASVKEVESVTQIQRENTRRRIIVGFNVHGRDVQTIVNDLKARVEREIKLPPGYSIVYGGSFENMTAAKNRLLLVVPVALLLIFMLLYFAFNSIKQGLLIYSAIPLSAIGGILALWSRGMPFSISAGVGFIALFGVAVLNGILLVTEFNRLKREGAHDVHRIVIHATKSKLRAVLMTAIVPAMGFIPMAISTGAGGEVQKPLATVVIGGLVVSTFLTLFVLPMLYILFEKGFRHLKHLPKAATVCLLFLLPVFVSAQKSMSLQQAIDRALSANPLMQAARQEEKYFHALEGTAFNPDRTELSIEYGQVNSFANDSRFSIAQSFQLPGVYKRQRQVSRDATALSKISTSIRSQNLATEVKQTFYTLLLLKQRLKLLQRADSLFSAVVDKSKLRLKAGEADVLEKATAGNQHLLINSQLKTLEAEIAMAENRLKQLLHTEEDVEPAADNWKFSSPALMAAMDSSPVLKWYEAQIAMATHQHQLEKSQLWPGFSLGYNNMSITGWQKINDVDEKYFGPAKRFSSVSVGIDLPIFQKAQRSRIKAAELLIVQRKKEADATASLLGLELRNAVATYQRQAKLLESYTSAGLPNADTILATASRKLAAGEIAYLEWVMVVNTAIAVQSDYLQLLQQHNELAIAIERLTSNK